MSSSEKSFFTEKFPIEKLKLYDRNPRKITAKAIEAVSKSIRMNGALDPIEADEDGIILAGHTRYKAYKELGYTEVPVVQHTGMTAIQKRTYRIASNKTAEYSEWDDELLAAELKDIETEIDRVMMEDSTGTVNDYDFKHEDHWQDMPEFDQPGIKPYKELICRFMNEQDYIDFQNRIEQKLTDKTKSIWHPAQDLDSNNRNMEYSINE